MASSPPEDDEIDYKNVALIISYRNYKEVIYFSGEKKDVRISLAQAEFDFRKLNIPVLRISRSVLLNKNCISKIDKKAKWFLRK